jgi:hypothetical protein
MQIMQCLYAILSSICFKVGFCLVLFLSPCLQFCCLCYVRGGALKRTTDARWAHILCALLLPGVAFKDSVCKEPISVLSVSKVNIQIVSINT